MAGRTATEMFSRARVRLLVLVGALLALLVWWRGRRLRAVPRALRHPLLLAPAGPTSKRELAMMRPLIAIARPVLAGVERSERQVPTKNGPVRALLYEPAGRRPGSGALVWFHGGGLVMGSADHDNDIACRVAGDLGVLVVSIDYRLAPEHPFPAGRDDCYAGFAWTVANAAELGIDPTRVAVGGASAGGGLAAAVAQLAHDLAGVGGPEPCFQWLVYPMLDDRTTSQVGPPLMWGAEANRFAWSAYLDQPAGAPDVAGGAVPGRERDLAGLAPAWIGVGDNDLFYGECVAYSARLRDAGVECELTVIPGMYHAADRLRPRTGLVHDFCSHRTAALRRAIAPPVPSQHSRNLGDTASSSRAAKRGQGLVGSGRSGRRAEQQK